MKKLTFQQHCKTKSDGCFEKRAWMNTRDYNVLTNETPAWRAATPEARLLDAAFFAASKHQFQKRKDDTGTPYINHPLAVAFVLQNVGNVTDVDVLIAAVLHDTIEDTDTTADEIRARFGDGVANYVLEVTDDKTLGKAACKRAQIERVRAASDGAKLIKMADKISNVWDCINIPVGWTVERARGYACWSNQVALAAASVNVEPYTGLFKMLESLMRCTLVDHVKNTNDTRLLPPTEEEQAACLAAFYALMDSTEH